ncbi:techylectin-5A-like [Ornithodoros turicata]|uniref:techylectin-5A-like n=1 Tax=Ornithodoros turicata TaxID=34597 RepID=UPI003138C08F
MGESRALSDTLRKQQLIANPGASRHVLNVRKMIASALTTLIVASTIQCALPPWRTSGMIEECVATLKELLPTGRPSDCADIFATGKHRSGIYDIFPYKNSPRPVSAYCDMETDGGGWTVIQRRGQFGNSPDYFYKKWKDYVNGFGHPAGEYWLGLNAIHALTSNKAVELRIQLGNSSGDILTADYSVFKVADEKQHFKLTVGGYSGREGSDSFSDANGAMFTTQDQDHDLYWGNCAVLYKGAWWYQYCHTSNLNGLNYNGQHSTFADGIEWSKLDGKAGLYYYSFPKVEMKIRDVSFLTPVMYGTLY